MSCFGHWLWYNLETREGDLPGGLIFHRPDSTVYPVVDLKVRHDGPYFGWKYSATRGTLESCQSQITGYLATQDTPARVRSHVGGGGNAAEASATLTHFFAKLVVLFPVRMLNLPMRATGDHRERESMKGMNLVKSASNIIVSKTYLSRRMRLRRLKSAGLPMILPLCALQVRRWHPIIFLWHELDSKNERLRR